jgi:hypothetical protein
MNLHYGIRWALCKQIGGIHFAQARAKEKAGQT